MFTGIIEEIGIISKVESIGSGLWLTVSAEKVLEGSKIGDSIAINGACQTVIAMNSSNFKVEVSEETIRASSLGELKTGSPVNLERAMRLGDRLGGHMISGHIDSTGELIDIKKAGIAKILRFRAPEEIAAYIIYKGSIAIDGISLTVSRADNNGREFEVTVITHTFENTILATIRIGQNVNLEADLVAKYIEKMVNNQTTKPLTESRITPGFLAEHGFV